MVFKNDQELIWNVYFVSKILLFEFKIQIFRSAYIHFITHNSEKILPNKYILYNKRIAC